MTDETIPLFFPILAQNLKEARVAAGLSQKALAEKVGTGQSAIALIESPTNTALTLQTLHRVATALGCDLTVRLTKPAIKGATDATKQKAAATADPVDVDAKKDRPGGASGDQPGHCGVEEAVA